VLFEAFFFGEEIIPAPKNTSPDNARCRQASMPLNKLLHGLFPNLKFLIKGG
jgi:hypothetical protein